MEPINCASVYESRRLQFLKAMGDGIAIFPAAPTSIRSQDVEYRYRQDNDLYYLTGFPEPQSLCLLSPNHKNEKYILFVRPRNKDQETWTGKRWGVEGATEHFGADAAYPMDQLDRVLADHVPTAEKIYYGLGREERLNSRILDIVKQAKAQRPRSGQGPVSLIDPADILHEMRMYKSSPEVTLMKRAIEASASAHQAALEQTRPGMREYEIEAILEYHFRRNGAEGPAYPSIVASGANATVLHYISNDQYMNDGDLLLIDAGSEYGCYCSDVTRTFPVGRRFSGPQRDIYSLVLAAQERAIEMVCPGVTIDDVHDSATETLISGLRELRLLPGTTESILESGSYREFYMHRTSHWLGMDVHDVGKYRVDNQPRTLEPGMILTVEPGLYISEGSSAPNHYQGIGVRIEDDVLVTESGHQVLTDSIIKDTDDLETVRGTF